jgi:SmpA / OmlA family
MRIRLEFRWLALTVFLLSGCAALRAPSIPPGASMADVESKIGKPVDVLSTPAGDVVWQYPSGPFGQQTYIVTFGKDERVRSVSQALTWERFATIRKGMSREEIRLMFGRPFTSVTYRRLDEEVWSYRYLIPVNDNRIFNVHFDAQTGRVKNTSDQRDELFHPITTTGGPSF